MKFHATPPINGTFASYITHPEDFCFKLDKISLDEGALIEPLAVAVHACTKLKIESGSHVIITGAGPIGIVAIKVAKASGATKIVSLDIEDKRL